MCCTSLGRIVLRDWVVILPRLGRSSVACCCNVLVSLRSLGWIRVLYSVHHRACRYDTVGSTCMQKGEVSASDLRPSERSDKARVQRLCVDPSTERPPRRRPCFFSLSWASGTQLRCFSIISAPSHFPLSSPSDSNPTDISHLGESLYMRAQGVGASRPCNIFSDAQRTTEEAVLGSARN